MPLNSSINKVLIIGSGPIVIGQACEFDYSGTQACKALKEEGVEVVLVNSNPATIMTDTKIADHVYIEPIEVSTIERIIQIEKPDAILPIMGGQTALNMAIELEEKGVLDKFSIDLIGLSTRTIRISENRALFRTSLQEIGLAVPHSYYLSNIHELDEIRGSFKYPLIVRASYTLGGEFGGIVTSEDELDKFCNKAFENQKELLIEESLIGWKEIELELMRDHNGNCIVVCGIENLDPMGTHTGDSITVAPIQTLTDKEYQEIRRQAFMVMEKVGMTSGGCNVQFAIHPKSGKIFCIEINPRVSRSSALASKATGFPIAKIAAKIALGYNLDELNNSLTESKIPCSFEPTIDYVATKIPRFNFDKFLSVNENLTTHMKSVGEVLAIGRTFKESLCKAIASLEVNYDLKDQSAPLEDRLRNRSANKLWSIFDAFRERIPFDSVVELSGYDPWFLDQIKSIIDVESNMSSYVGRSLDLVSVLSWKKLGFSDDWIASLTGRDKSDVAVFRNKHKMSPVYKRIDTCSAEFPTQTAYMYSTYEIDCESEPTHDKKFLVLGSGANRIGQGIEFDYCCVHAIEAIRKMGHQAIMMNCNPSTVSTDYDIADRLYLEPLTIEHVREVVKKENPDGIIIQFGGQTSLNIGEDLDKEGFPVLGTPFKFIKLTEDRGEFKELIEKLNILQPRNLTASTRSDLEECISKIGFPCILRPSYVIGGNSMQIIRSKKDQDSYIANVAFESVKPILVEQFLDNGLEVEVDAIADGSRVSICGVIEHIDPAGVHSGDSACYLFPNSIPERELQKIEKYTEIIGLRVGIIGCFNIQFVIHEDQVYILEVNARASRTVPLLSKITGYPIAEIATSCALGQSLDTLGIPSRMHPRHFALKIPVFPFQRLNVMDTSLGPCMKSTGEVLALGDSLESLMCKAHIYSQQFPIHNEQLRAKLMTDSEYRSNQVMKL